MAEKVVPVDGAAAGTVRTWAREQGLSVGHRGSLSAEIVTAYNEAHEAVNA